MRKSLALFLCALAPLLSACSLVGTQDTFSPLTLYAVKAGKADAFLLCCGGETLILDTGENDDGDKILSLLQSLDIEEAETVILSHYDKDHVGGAGQILRGIRADRVLGPDYEEDSAAKKDMDAALAERSMNLTPVTEITTFCVGSAEITVYPTKAAADEDNDNSLIVTVSHGDVNFLFPGDAEEARLREWLSEHQESYDFLKAPHHGHRNDMSEEFYRTVAPKTCVITDSEKNPADPQILALLSELSCKSFSTSNGNLVFASDGKKVFTK